jgi:hypothetical protein
MLWPIKGRVFAFQLDSTLVGIQAYTAGQVYSNLTFTGPSRMLSVASVAYVGEFLYLRVTAGNQTPVV